MFIYSMCYISKVEEDVGELKTDRNLLTETHT